MDDYKEHLRRLAVHDAALVEEILSDENTGTASALDERTAALVRVAATIAVDAAPSSFQHAVTLALAYLVHEGFRYWCGLLAGHDEANDVGDPTDGIPTIDNANKDIAGK